jgi:hypothetical protein
MKRGFSPDIARIRGVLDKNFPVEIRDENGKYSFSYGAFTRMAVWIDKKKLCVETESSKEAGDEEILDTNRRYRVFLEEATGYSAKERLKKAKKDVQGD